MRVAAKHIGLFDTLVFFARQWRSPAGVTQLVECDLAKVDVAGSNPVSRSILCPGAIAMKNRSFLLSVVFLLVTFSAFAQDYKLEPIATAAPGLAAAYEQVIQGQGFRVNGASGA